MNVLNYLTKANTQNTEKLQISFIDLMSVFFFILYKTEHRLSDSGITQRGITCINHFS